MAVRIEMAMPECCGKCIFNQLGRYVIKEYCIVSGYSIKDDTRRNRYCPLQEVKE